MEITKELAEQKIAAMQQEKDQAIAAANAAHGAMQAWQEVLLLLSQPEGKKNGGI